MWMHVGWPLMFRCVVVLSRALQCTETLPGSHAPHGWAACVAAVVAVAATGEFADANEELLKTLPPPYVAVQYYLSGEVWPLLGLCG